MNRGRITAFSSLAALSFFAGLACSGSASDAGDPATASSSAGDENPCATTETLPLTGAPGATPTIAPSDDVGAEDSPFVSFVDCSTGFRTDEVFDADRELVHFDASLGAMVSGVSGDSVAGWAVTGADLSWSRSGVRFRVRFGTEAGERRAYFTEAGPGTICNLTVAGPDTLFISATSETPPNP